jgi:predicted ATPase
MWKVSVCVHDCGGTPKNMACRTRHGAGVRGSAPRPHVAPRPARCGGLQQPIVAAPAGHPAPGRTGVAAVLRPACGQQGARPAARRGVGEASGSAGDSRVRGGAGGDATGKGALYFLYSQHRTYAFLYGEDTGVMCHSFAARALWYLGYPDQALARSHEAVTLAQHVAHPFSLSYVLSTAALFHSFRREVRFAQERAEAAIVLATEQGFPHWMAVGSILCGWALAHQGQVQDGIEQLMQSLRAFRATGAELQRPYYLALLAEVHGIIGQPGTGLAVLTEALALVEHTGERYYEAEIHRLKGVLLLQQNSNNQAEAETCFHHAIVIAQNQQAKSFELRTATSLARLWQQQGKRQEAHDLLAPVYHWFTEGFDTADLKDAKALLEALA